MTSSTLHSVGCFPSFPSFPFLCLSSPIDIGDNVPLFAILPAPLTLKGEGDATLPFPIIPGEETLEYCRWVPAMITSRGVGGNGDEGSARTGGIEERMECPELAERADKALARLMAGAASGALDALVGGDIDL
jgi:uncharacterized protein YbjQ (UPF0145 family)